MVDDETKDDGITVPMAGELDSVIKESKKKKKKKKKKKEKTEEEKEEEEEAEEMDNFFVGDTSAMQSMQNVRRRVIRQDRPQRQSSIAPFKIQAELERLPTNEMGEIDQSDLDHFAERIVRSKTEAKRSKRVTLYSIIISIVLTLLMFGMVILAVNLAKDTSVHPDGQLVATGGLDTPIVVKADAGIHIHADTSPLVSIPIRRARRALRRILQDGEGEGEGFEDVYMDGDTVALVQRNEVETTIEAVIERDAGVHVDFDYLGSHYDVKLGTDSVRRHDGENGEYSIDNLRVRDDIDVDHIVSVICPDGSDECDIVAGTETTNAFVRRLGHDNVYDDECCFSPTSTVQTKDRGSILLEQLQLGESVLTASGIYKKVMAFQTYSPPNLTKQATYQKIVTNTGNEIVMTPRHMIFRCNDQSHPVPASIIQVGDCFLVTSQQQGTVGTKEASTVAATPPLPPFKTTKATVVSIEQVFVSGGFSPLTEDGTIIVNGIVSSCYSNPPGEQSDAYVKVFGMTTFIHRHTFTHALFTPVLHFCNHVTNIPCGGNWNVNDDPQTRPSKMPIDVWATSWHKMGFNYFLCFGIFFMLFRVIFVGEKNKQK